MADKPIYVIGQRYYGVFNIIGYAETEDKAEHYCKAINKTYHYGELAHDVYYLEINEIDSDGIDPPYKEFIEYAIRANPNGEVDEASLSREFIFDRQPCPATAWVKHNENNDGSLLVIVTLDTVKRTYPYLPYGEDELDEMAIKIAKDELIKYIENNDF